MGELISCIDIFLKIHDEFQRIGDVSSFSNELQEQLIDWYISRLPMRFTIPRINANQEEYFGIMKEKFDSKAKELKAVRERLMSY